MRRWQVAKLEARITVPSVGYPLLVDDVTATVAGGTYYHSTTDDGADAGLTSLADAVAAAINAIDADTWTVTLDSSTGLYTIATDGSAKPVAWSSNALRDLLGFTGSQSGATSYTGTAQAQGLWISSYGYQAKHGSPSFLGHPRSDKHDYENAAGYCGGVAGQTSYRHMLRFPMETDAKANTVSEVTANESFQTFLEDSIHGRKEWATVGGPIRFHGDSTTYTTWYVPGMNDYDPARIEGEWDGLWSIEIPRLVRVPGTEAGSVAVAADAYYRVDQADDERITEDDQQRVTEAA